MEGAAGTEAANYPAAPSMWAHQTPTPPFSLAQQFFGGLIDKQKYTSKQPRPSSFNIPSPSCAPSAQSRFTQISRRHPHRHRPLS